MLDVDERNDLVESAYEQGFDESYCALRNRLRDEREATGQSSIWNVLPPKA